MSVAVAFGGIRKDASYAPREFCQRLQLTETAYLAAVRRGLPTHRVGKQDVLSGPRGQHLVRRSSFAAKCLAGGPENVSPSDL